MKQLLLICILLMVSCKSEPKIVENDTEDQKKSNEITAEDISKLEYTDYVLSPESAEAVSGWHKFQDLQVQMDHLKNADFSFFKVESKIMAEFISELKAEQPEVVKTPSIRARITVLETNLQRLQNLSTLDNIKKDKILEALKELFIANVNLKLQINKKFEKEAQQIQIPK